MDIIHAALEKLDLPCLNAGCCSGKKVNLLFVPVIIKTGCKRTQLGIELERSGNPPGSS
jgi:hypothetical protein